MERKNVIFVITTLVSTLGQFTADLYLPSLYALSSELHTSYSLTQLTITTYMIGFALSQLIYGPISDGIGRKKPLLFGLVLCVIGSFMCLTAHKISILIIGRLLQGLGIGAGGTLFRPILSDLFQGAKLAKYASISSLIGIWFLAVGPVFGGYIQRYTNWRVNFAVLTILSLIALLGVILFVPETNLNICRSHLKIQQIKNNLVTLLTNPTFIGYNFCSLLTYGAIAAWLTAGSIVLQKSAGLNATEYGWSYFLTGLAFIFGTIINIKIVARLGTQRIILIGIICMLIAGLSMLILKNLGYINAGVIIGPTLLIFFGASFIFPNSFVGAIKSFAKTAGITTAVFGASRILGGAIVSSLMALVHDQTQLPMALAFTICALLAWLCYYYLATKITRLPEVSE